MPAQDSGNNSRWRVEPAIGVWRQERGVNTDRLVGQYLGLQLSREQRRGVHLTASAVFHRMDEAHHYVWVSPTTGESRTDVWNREILSFSLGTAIDLRTWGSTTLGLGVAAGPGWSRVTLAETTGSASGPFIPAPGDDSEWQLVGFILPSLALRHAVAARVELTATARALLGIGDIQPGMMPAVGAGVAYRF